MHISAPFYLLILSRFDSNEFRELDFAVGWSYITLHFKAEHLQKP